MIITDSSIGMDSRRTYTSVSMDAYMRSRSVTEMSAKDFLSSLNGAIGSKDAGECDDTEKTGKKEKNNKKDADTLSGNTDDSLEYLKGKFNEISTSKVARSSKIEEDLRSAIRYMCLNFLLMLLLGKNGGADGEDVFLKAFGISPKGSSAGFGKDDLSALSFTQITDSVTAEHYEAERENTSFSTKGIVKTSDGRELDFNIDLSMSRSFEQYTRETGTFNSLNVTLCDPLVINYDTPAANISDQKFYFDLNTDGKMDKMSMIGAGSGFLALDLNEDGKINDGSELFGTKSGDGFKDLAKYDSDGNGWIDEADEVFDKLRIFSMNDDGTEVQYKLKDKGVGAIYLGNKDTEFSITNKENQINAMVRKTGLFLYESGAAGTVQHVDMAVELGA